jgi:hypothetical protein
VAPTRFFLPEILPPKGGNYSTFLGPVASLGPVVSAFRRKDKRASSPVKVKSKWDKQILKQEFTNPQAKLVETWSIDGADHLVLTAKVESLKFITPERKAVFDRQ